MHGDDESKLLKIDAEFDRKSETICRTPPKTNAAER